MRGLSFPLRPALAEAAGGASGATAFDFFLSPAARLGGTAFNGEFGADLTAVSTAVFVEPLGGVFTSTADFFSAAEFFGKAGFTADGVFAFTASLSILAFFAGTVAAFVWAAGLFKGAFAVEVFLAGLFGL